MKTYARILVRCNRLDVSDEVCLKRFVGTIQPSVLTYLLKGDDIPLFINDDGGKRALLRCCLFAFYNLPVAEKKQLLMIDGYYFILE